MPISELERQLEAYYEQHRNQQLASRLEDAVQTMRKTVLLGARFEELSGGKKSNIEGFSPSDETVQKVEQVKTAWESNQFDRTEDKLTGLTEALDEEEQRIRGEIQGVKHKLSSHLKGLNSLNQRTNRIPPDRIRIIEEEIEDLDEVSYQTDKQFSEQEQSIRKQVRQNVVIELENIENKLMEPFRGSGAEEHVRSLISGGSVQLSSLSDKEIDELQGSLGAHLSLQLRGE
ncbi:hypothetical protein [Natronosalvus rutilus]|uniref:Uncharacterized protein n=1 Tax=Natronosalvus rutilus TaxID=2953753 RepID=A0A9E7NEI8_9EURY|nr:hypothetical protein [Natronosalvus rutilus]UTF55583.1 hypothetical protein NGM29_19455 [Natronosalvus rutilus]